MRTPCPHCGLTFRHGERYACCSGCGRVFVGQSAFDAHQSIVGNRAVCADPATQVRRDGEPRFVVSTNTRTSESGTFWSLAPRPGQRNPWAREVEP